MTATPEQDEIQFPDRVFVRVHGECGRGIPAQGKKYTDYVHRKLDSRLLQDVWDAGYYVYDILHTSGTERFPDTAWYESRALAKKR